MEYYDINESIPIIYEKDDDEINTLYQKNISCEYKRKSITEMGTGVLILMIILGVFTLCIIGVIIWKIIDIHKQKENDARKNPSLFDLGDNIENEKLNNNDNNNNIEEAN